VQSLSLETFDEMMTNIRAVAQAVGRPLRAAG
jgi:hypothetical protein